PRARRGAGQQVMTMNTKTTQEAAQATVPPPAIAEIGVIGAGQMGNGIAHVSALAGLNVALLDVKAEALERALGVMAKNLDRQVAKGAISAEDKAAALGRIKTGTDYALFANADLVIEA